MNVQAKTVMGLWRCSICGGRDIYTRMPKERRFSALVARTEAGKLNIKDMEKVECEYCSGLFLIAQAVVLNEKGEFHYYCSKGCAMKRRTPKAWKRQIDPETMLNS